MAHKVWFHRSSALVWATLGVAAFLLGFQDAIWLVWIASVYANVKSDWAAAEAADDRAVLANQEEILRLLREKQ